MARAGIGCSTPSAPERAAILRYFLRGTGEKRTLITKKTDFSHGRSILQVLLGSIERPHWNRGTLVERDRTTDNSFPQITASKPIPFHTRVIVSHDVKA